jgi:DNA-binding transcriptional LysR family regulator
MHTSNWDNLRYVLSVVDAGSVSGAARELGVNHATVLRRIAAFESEYGTVIFDKSANGYRPIPSQAAVIEAVREVETSILAVQRLMRGANPLLSGIVRISSTDTICQYLLPDVLSALLVNSPQLELELLSNNSHLNFARLEADLFVRPAMTLPEDMSGEIATHLVFRAYGTSTCPDRWFGLSGPLEKSAASDWLCKTIPKNAMISGSDSFVVLSRLAQTGSGIAILPSFVGDNIPGLIQLGDKMPSIRIPIWVGSHRDLRDTPRIRAVKKSVIAHLSDKCA